ncbi:hypothetical protein [Saccharothrix obliqua]|uniref:hypothetical protein n=1 Tax=Saccharothrix obliqua TaxID=2861747 RepID=UPI001C5E290B|nr:hypothetical protein [Saccharothrix obliqua]MBW4718169.1 hypothetical protein [Saccharothrix obliqua]
MDGDGGRPTAWARSAGLLIAVGAGWLLARSLGVHDISSSPGYFFAINALLGFGLYASTRGIDLAEFREHWGTVLAAVTLGVGLKVALIFGFLYLFYSRPEHLLLAVAVAQIDPLSVAALRAGSRLSEAGKTLLAAWSSFDDPITVLLSVYLTALVIGGDAPLSGAGLGTFSLNIGLNLVLAGAAFAAWRVLRRRAPSAAGWRRVVGRVVAVVAVLGVGALAVRYSLLPALALIGLFFRPGRDADVDRTARGAMYAGTFAVGAVLVDGVDPTTGALLGVGAFLAQVVAAALLTARPRWRGDRTRLALGQQNGLTAIILALTLQPVLPGAVAVIAPAVVVVNLLHAITNSLHDRFRPPVTRPDVPRPPVAPPAAPPARRGGPPVPKTVAVDPLARP